MLKKLRKVTAEKRARLFLDFVSTVFGGQRPVRVLDIGGTASFWSRLGIRQENGLQIVLLNNHHIDKTNQGYKGGVSFISERVADVADLTVEDFAAFDLVFSNSMIEHLSSFEEQKKLCDLIESCGKPYFVQVPNKCSLIDPHFAHPFVPFFACYPKEIQARLLTVAAFGSGSKSKNLEEARRRLFYYTPIGRKTFLRLMPGGALRVERHLGIPMSLVMMKKQG